MRSVSLRLEDIRNMVLNLGFVGENEHTRVMIDCKKAYDQYPTASASLKVTPPEGETYPKTVERDGDFILWDVTDSDLTSEGSGEYQLSFSVGDVVAKSYIGRFRVCRSIVATGETPDAVQDWIDAAEDVLEAVEDAIPEGGTAGQVLGKLSDDDYDLGWIDQTGGGGTSNYNELTNKPKIAGTTLSGDKSLADLGIASATDLAAKYTKPNSGIPASDLASGVVPDVTGKADKVSSATNGNFAGLDSNGNLMDSGKKASDFLTSHQDISGKADKVSSATNGNFAGLDSNGNLTDSGKKASDFLTSHQDISGKADKVSSATNGNFAGLDGNGNLTDSGKKASDFLTSHQDISGKADKTDTVLLTSLSRGRKEGSTVGQNSFAFGNNVEATNYFSIAEGYGTKATMPYARAEGYETVASGTGSHAEGDTTVASLSGMHAEGAYNVIPSAYPEWVANTHYYVGDKAVTPGGSWGIVCIVENTDSSLNMAHWDYTSSTGNVAHVIGNGDSSARSNAQMIDWDGNEYLAGDLYVHCNADSSGGYKVLADITQNVSGLTPSITGQSGVRYICGTCSTLSITAPASGIIDVIFQSGSTATVLTVTSAKSGVSAIKWAGGFDPTSLDANTTYEINIMDGEYGVVGSWT